MQNQSSRVYSYLRFSDPKQASGGSIDRQIQYAQRWAEQHQIPLDASLTMRDEGLSAYHQHHIKQGALGVFMAAIDAGKIQPGSVLIVEGLDRLSRAEPILAQAQLAQIINAGITVVTASDGREYNRETLKAQPMDLVYSLLVMIRAHEESDTKSKRVKAAIKRQCQGWIQGSYRGIVRNGHEPGWIDEVDGKFVINDDRAAGLNRLIDLWMQGHGFESALTLMRDECIDMRTLPTAASTLYKILRNKCLIGIKTIEVNDEIFELEGYYPALITHEKFEQIQTAIAGRVRRKGKGEIPSILTGMGITFCGYCGHGMSSQNTTNRPKKLDGNPQDGHRRLLCSGGPHRCDHPGGCSSVPIERALLTWCADQVNLDALLQDANNHEKEARATLAAVRKNVAGIEKKLSKLADAMLEDDEAVPLIFARKARELEGELTEAKADERKAEIALSQIAAIKSPKKAEAWAKLYAGVMALDNDARMKARKMVTETFERIVIYHHGITPEDIWKDPIDVILVAKGGSSRLVRLHRRSGMLISGEETHLR